MTKSKPKQPPKNTCTQTAPDFDECVQDGWVIVKKQNVTITIPFLPVTKSYTIPSIATKEVDHNHITTPSQPDPLVTVPLATTKPITTYSNPPNLIKKPKPRNPHYGEPSYLKTFKRCGNMFNGHMLVNPKMRALNLERKLQRAGGLDRWLVSLGLGQFVKMFRCKRVGKVQLVNLTMRKLKDMGADAVGPRRKLMHAIDCLW